MPIVVICHACGAVLGHGVWRWECTACQQSVASDPPPDDDADDTDVWTDPDQPTGE